MLAPKDGERPSKRAVVAAGLTAYLLGTFPTAELISRYAGKKGHGESLDLRVAGTKNPGALNTAKLLGARWGAAVLGGDITKGAVACLLGRWIGGAAGAYAAGTAAVIGHCAPVWSGFRGGKGLATSAGTAAICFPAYMPFDVGLAAATLVLSKGRAGFATYVTSAVFILAAIYWWRAGKGNLWGPKPTLGLPLYAIASSAIIAYRFLTAPSLRPEQTEQPGRAGARSAASYAEELR